MTQQRKQRLRIIAALVALTAAPLTVKAGVPVLNEACAQVDDSGTCCPQAGSICVVGQYVAENHYYKTSGAC
jgi:hypothetical protein